MLNIPYKDKEKQNKYQNDWAKRNRKKISEYKKKKRKKVREKVKEYKQLHKCKICKESRWYCLDFHHKEIKSKNKRISRFVSDGASWNKVLNEINKCIIVCSNCHREIHFNKESEKKHTIKKSNFFDRYF